MTDYQKQFLDKMAFKKNKQAYRNFYAPEPNTGKGYFITYEAKSPYQFVVANYIIKDDFELTFDSKKAYLRFGVIEHGVSRYDINNKKLTEFSPSPFIILENQISGKQTWQSGEHYKGTEFIVDMSVLKNDLMVDYPELMALLKLKNNFIYYYLPTEVVRIIDELKRLTISNQLTTLYLESCILRCFSIIIKELNDTGSNNFINQYNYSVMTINRERTARLTQSDVEAIHAAQHLLNQNLDDPPTINAMSKILFISEQKLAIGFKKIYGETIGQYVISQRMIHAAKLLVTSDLTVYDIAIKSGYNNTSNFAKTFKKHYKKTPLQFRKAHH